MYVLLIVVHEVPTKWIILVYNATLDMTKYDKHVDSKDIKNVGVISIVYWQYLDEPFTNVSFSLSNWTPVVMATFWKISW